MERIDTIIVARSRLFRDGFAQIVSARFAVVGAASLAEALAAVEQGRRPRLLIVESAAIQLGVLQRIRVELPMVKIVVLMDSDRMKPLATPAQCDIDGYLLKDISPETLEASLDLIMAGQAVMPSTFANAAFRDLAAAALVSDVRLLTPRESEVLDLLRRGCSNKEIARALDMSAATVKVHLKTVLRKLQVRNRTEAAMWAVSHLQGSPEPEGVTPGANREPAAAQMPIYPEELSEGSDPDFAHADTC